VFDAGAIEATLELDRGPFIRDLRAALGEATALTKKPFEVQLTTSGAVGNAIRSVTREQDRLTESTRRAAQAVSNEWDEVKKLNDALKGTARDMMALAVERGFTPPAGFRTTGSGALEAKFLRENVEASRVFIAAQRDAARQTAEVATLEAELGGEVLDNVATFKTLASSSAALAASNRILTAVNLAAAADAGGGPGAAGGGHSFLAGAGGALAGALFGGGGLRALGGIFAPGGPGGTSAGVGCD